eukprot:SAG22_NODE_682_length_7924_cov_25.432460_3_plen_122_part_00
MVQAGRSVLLQQRLAVAKLTHRRLAADAVFFGDAVVFANVIEHLGTTMLAQSTNETAVERLMRTHSRLAVYEDVVSDCRFAEPGGLIIGTVSVARPGGPIILLTRAHAVLNAGDTQATRSR